MRSPLFLAMSLSVCIILLVGCRGTSTDVAAPNEPTADDPDGGGPATELLSAEVMPVNEDNPECII